MMTYKGIYIQEVQEIYFTLNILRLFMKMGIPTVIYI